MYWNATIPISSTYFYILFMHMEKWVALNNVKTIVTEIGLILKREKEQNKYRKRSQERMLVGNVTFPCRWHNRHCWYTVTMACFSLGCYIWCEGSNWKRESIHWSCKRVYRLFVHNKAPEIAPGQHISVMRLWSDWLERYNATPTAMVLSHTNSVWKKHLPNYSWSL